MKWEYYVLLTAGNCGRGGMKDVKSLHFPCPQPPVKPLRFFLFNHLIPSFLFSHVLPFFLIVPLETILKILDQLII